MSIESQKMNWRYKSNDQVVGPLTEEAMKCDTKIAAGLADAGTSANCPSCGNELMVPPIEASQPPTARPSDPESQPLPSKPELQTVTDTSDLLGSMRKKMGDLRDQVAASDAPRHALESMKKKAGEIRDQIAANELPKEAIDVALNKVAKLQDFAATNDQAKSTFACFTKALMKPKLLTIIFLLFAGGLAVSKCSKTQNEKEAAAMVALADSYETGSGVTQDYAKSAKLYKDAAEIGNAEAQYKIGEFFQFGKGVEKNECTAANYYKKSAKQGNFPSQVRLGTMYVLGKGVQVNYVFAYMWFNIALGPEVDSSKADSRFLNMAKKLFKQMDDSLTKDQIAEAKKLSRDWKSIN
jgi:hypothetical protein